VEDQRDGAYPHDGTEELTRVLEIEAALEITTADGRTIELNAAGSRWRAEIGSLELRRPTLRLVGSSLTLVRRLSRVLAAQNVTLVITRSGRPLAELGAGVSGGPVAKLLGASRVRVYRRT
jgi:hypothetical protein